MCSILLTNVLIDRFDEVNYFLKFRGPDHTSVYKQKDITFIHNLLSICGEFAPQPFVDDGIVAMHNGEIYRYGSEYKSDGYSIIPSYKKYGEEFAKHLDGEFAITLVDFNENFILLCTDTFRTKPLWFSIKGKNFAISTYRSPIQKLGFDDVQKVPPNSIVKIHLQTMQVQKICSNYNFDLVQYKNNFDDWTSSFEDSIRKRTENNREKIFIGLSSGYDSGAIACELDKQKIDYHSYTVLGKEDMNIVKLRSNHRKTQHTNIERTQENYFRAHKYIEDTVETYYYNICSSSSSYNEFDLRLHDDSGSNGFSLVCENAKKDGIKIYLSGSGSDEIFSDYGFNGNKIYPHSNFGGLFPQDLSKIFPWNSFYGSTMESYLAKEEYISGSYGIEGRYPFLDKMVVQEFLWLSAELKNSAYKSVLDNYLKNNNYPFVPNQKIGF